MEIEEISGKFQIRLLIKGFYEEIGKYYWNKKWIKVLLHKIPNNFPLEVNTRYKIDYPISYQFGNKKRTIKKSVGYAIEYWYREDPFIISKYKKKIIPFLKKNTNNKNIKRIEILWSQGNWDKKNKN
jgi:hypothetical protein